MSEKTHTDSTVLPHLRCILLLLRTPNLFIPTYAVQAVCVTHEYPGVLRLLSGGKERRGSLSCGLLYPECVQGTASVFAELRSTLVSMRSPQPWPFPVSDTHTHPWLSSHLPYSPARLAWYLLAITDSLTHPHSLWSVAPRTHEPLTCSSTPVAARRPCTHKHTHTQRIESPSHRRS